MSGKEDWPTKRRIEYIQRYKYLNIPIAKTCRLIGLNRSLYYYHLKDLRGKKDSKSIEEIKKVKLHHPTLGAKKIAKLLNQKNISMNHKKVSRLCFEYNLFAVKKKKRIRTINLAPRLPIPAKIEKQNQVWSIDFMCSRKNSKFKYQLLNTVDIFSKVSPIMEVKKSYRAHNVTENLNLAIGKHGKPEGIVTDNGVEFTSSHFRLWCEQNKIKHYLTEKGKPAQNCFVESFNSCVRREILDINKFEKMDDLQQKIEKWRDFYNKIRPHGSLGYLSPAEYIKNTQQLENAV